MRIHTSILIITVLISILWLECAKSVRKKKGSNLQTASSGAGQSYIRGCYYTNWAQYRFCDTTATCDPPDAVYFPENYEANLCTHIFYAFVKMDSSTLTIVEIEKNDREMFDRWVKIKKSKQPNLKLMLSIGGWAYCKDQGGNAQLSEMSSSANKRKIFIKNTLAYVKDIQFDGFDWDWEYPEAPDRDNYASLIKEMADEFHNNGLLLTAAVPMAGWQIPNYDVPKLAASFDFINIMTYDIHGKWEWNTGHNSPLYGASGQDQLSVYNGAKNWENAGLPKHKLVVGFGTYGRSWTIEEPKNGTKPGESKIISEGMKGMYTKEAAFEAYFEICQKLEKGLIPKKNQHYDPVQRSPYYVYNDPTSGYQWMGYDNETSFTEKLQWLKAEKYAGAFVWTLDEDDFTGYLCPKSKGKKYPLIGLFSVELGGTYVPPKPGDKPPPAARPPGQPAGPSPAVQATGKPNYYRPEKGCLSDGLYANPKDCKTFYQCANGVAYPQPCPGDLEFNPSASVCDHPGNCKLPTNKPGNPDKKKRKQTGGGLVVNDNIDYAASYLFTFEGDTGEETHVGISNSQLAAQIVAQVTTPGPTQAPLPPGYDPGKSGCPGNGLFKDPTNCNRYYNCGEKGGAAVSVACPSTLVFDGSVCNYAQPGQKC